MSSLIRPWPYAAKSVVQFEHDAPTLTVWVIFRHPMDQTVKPPHAKWILLVDGVPRVVTGSSWIDDWTLKLIRVPTIPHPATVTLEYDGPDENLRTAWGKQWEPFGAIVATDVPFEWEHILEVDVPNTRVTINGQLNLSTLTVTAGLNQIISVNNINVIFFDCSAGDISVSGTRFGEDGQVLYLARLCITANDVTLNHQRVGPFQNFNLHAGADETLTGEYGGWTLACNRVDWFDLSHAKHT